MVKVFTSAEKITLTTLAELKLQISGILGVIVFLPGLFWGWLYSRHNSLLGVSISHLLIGWSGLFLLNPESLFQ